MKNAPGHTINYGAFFLASQMAKNYLKPGNSTLMTLRTVFVLVASKDTDGEELATTEPIVNVGVIPFTNPKLNILFVSVLVASKFTYGVEPCGKLTTEPIDRIGVSPTYPLSPCMPLGIP